MALEENKAVVRRYFESGVNSQDTATTEELVHPDIVIHYGDRTVNGRDAYHERKAAGHQAFPDWSVTVEDLVAEGDLVAVRSTIKATHNGPYNSDTHGVVQPTASQVSLTQQVLARVQDGKIAELWVERDGLPLLRQIGALK